MMGWYGVEMSPLGWIATGVCWVVLLALIVWLIARLLPGCSKTAHPIDDSPVENLNHRLAGGEINLTAWQAQRDALKAPVTGSTDQTRDSG